jgi:hypothetical protein
MATGADADWQLASVGRDEGSEFVARCPQFSDLVGIDVYSRDDIDAVRPVCATAFGATAVGEAQPLGAPLGGSPDGANYTRLLCGGERPVVTGAYVNAEFDATSGVNNVHLFCGVAGDNPSPRATPDAAFDGPVYVKEQGVFVRFREEDANATAHCPRNLVAVGVHGYSPGDWIHALGLICGEPGFTAKTVGRFKPLNPVGKTAVKKLSGIGATHFCEKYATAAVGAALRNRELGCGGDGGRWTTDFNAHLNWCLGLGGDQTVTNSEAAARDEALAQCEAGN